MKVIVDFKLYLVLVFILGYEMLCFVLNSFNSVFGGIDKFFS